MDRDITQEVNSALADIHRESRLADARADFLREVDGLQARHDALERHIQKQFAEAYDIDDPSTVEIQVIYGHDGYSRVMNIAVWDKPTIVEADKMPSAYTTTTRGS